MGASSDEFFERTECLVTKDVSGTASPNGTAGNVSVIVQPASTWNPLLDSLVSDLGGVLVDTMQNLPLRVVSLPVDQLEELGARDEIRYVSLDRELKSFGHITQTTGTDALRLCRLM